MMKAWWRKIFTKPQVVGIIVMLLIVVGGGLLLHFIPQWLPTATQPNELALSTEKADEIEAHLQDLYTERKYERKDVPLRMHLFDPNTADSITLREVGFPHWMARNVLRYRAKGGVFRNTDAVRKVYGMSDSLFAQIRPYIQIDTTYFAKRDSVRWASDTTRFVYAQALKKDTVLELNAADTTQLQWIRGIGRYSAVQIVRYRQALGGFVNVEQLRDIAELPTVADSLFQFFTVCTDSVKKIPVNMCSVERLNRHPYLSFTQAKAIYTLRRERIELTGIEDLRSLECLSKEDIRKVSPYLDFQPRKRK